MKLTYSQTSNIYISMDERVFKSGVTEIRFKPYMATSDLLSINKIFCAIYKKDASNIYQLHTEIGENNVAVDIQSQTVTAKFNEAPLTAGTYKIVVEINAENVNVCL